MQSILRDANNLGPILFCRRRENLEEEELCLLMGSRYVRGGPADRSIGGLRAVGGDHHTVDQWSLAACLSHWLIPKPLPKRHCTQDYWHEQRALESTHRMIAA